MANPDVDMSLFSKRNIDKAKDLFEKNKDKIADGVDKATETSSNDAAETDQLQPQPSRPRNWLATDWPRAGRRK